jgi:hypothetical protein
MKQVANFSSGMKVILYVALLACSSEAYSPVLENHENISSLPLPLELFLWQSLFRSYKAISWPWVLVSYMETYYNLLHEHWDSKDIQI